MSEPDLDKPLKRRAAAPARGPKPKIDGVTTVALVAAGALSVAAGWALFVSDPLGGEPVATASIERRAPAGPAGEARPEPAQGAAARGEPAPKSRDGVPIVRPGEPMPKSGPVIIQVPGAEHGPAGHDAAATQGAAGEIQTAMLEDSRFGQLPRIASDGRRPLDAYARAGPPKGPRVALIVAGLGTGREATQSALKALPAEVTLAFSPYGADVAEVVAQARADGHEVLIQAPMEPFAYPSNDPGPQTLLASLPPPANLDRLRWALGRARGYVGVAPLGGGRFLQSDDALQPVFTELARRGLMFVGQSDRESRFGEVAARSGLATAQPASPIDLTPDAASIDFALAELERAAKQNGAAVGWASATPLTLKRIEAWRAGLSARGVALAPVSAALKPQGPS